jgi:hypothetical protein
MLAVPYLLLYGASLVAWPWRALDLPGTIGVLTPPGTLLLTSCVVLGLVALRRNLPLSRITWVPAGQGAVVLLATSMLTSETDPTEGVAFILAYVVMFVLAAGIGVMVAQTGPRLAVAIGAFFILAQVTRFPVFEIDAATVPANASLLTLLAVTRVTVEVALTAWLALRLVERESDRRDKTVWLLAGLVLLHGVLASWEIPVLNGEATARAIAINAIQWTFWAGVQMLIILILARLRLSWFQPVSQPEAAPAPSPAPAPMQAAAHPNPTRKPTRRRRRR